MDSALNQLDSSYDAIVVGARCAGSATAMLLAQRGLRTLAIDRSPLGRDTLSTHALMRGGVLQLHRWGLLDEIRMQTPAVRTTTFHYGADAVEFAIEPRDGVDALYAPRRTVLDELLVRAASRAGAQVLHRVRMTGLLRRRGRVSGVIVEDAARRSRRIDAGIVIGADGMRSAVARQVAAPVYERGRHAAGVIYGYWSDVDVTGYHWYYERGVSTGVIPTNDGLTCVFTAAPAERFTREVPLDFERTYSRILEDTSPDLLQILKKARRAGGLRPFPGCRGFLRQSWGPGWALVGDAGYFKDPITAHGITDALRDAELLARAIQEGSDRALARYQTERDEIGHGLFRLSDEIASFDWTLESLQERHRALSREMNRGVARVKELDAADAARPAKAS